MEGGELLLSISTVRPFSLAAGLERMEKEGLNSKCQRFWGTGCGKSAVFLAPIQLHFWPGWD